MNESTIEFLDKALDEYFEKGKKPKKIHLGYKLYRRLMNYEKFFTGVVESALDPDKRRYRGVKLKVTQDDYELTFIDKD